MSVTGTLTIQNRIAHLHGHGSSSKLGRPCKAVIQVRNRSNGRHVLVISTRKEVVTQEYDVLRIQNVRSRFVDEGLATIEIDDPPMNIMLQQCNTKELKNFVELIKNLRGYGVLKSNDEGKSKSPSAGTVSTSGKSTNGKNDKEEAEETPGTLRRHSLKRARSPELSKNAIAKVKRALTTKLSVRSRKDYPSEFSSHLEEIKVAEIGLQKIDSRWLKLRHLTRLEIKGNRLTNVDSLRKLPGRLFTLILAQNRIESLSNDFFSNAVFRGLVHLDLSQNALTKLPSSLNELTSVSFADFSGNKLRFLHYNWMNMLKLRRLDLSQNCLTFIPGSITRLELLRLDMSNNPNLYLPLEGNAPESSYVGYNEMPTLFETASVKTMNLLRRSRKPIPAELPDVVEQYLRAGKFCSRCLKLTLRYKITTRSLLPMTLCTGVMASCLVSPAGLCTVKDIVCYNCDMHLRQRALQLQMRR